MTKEELDKRLDKILENLLRSAGAIYDYDHPKLKAEVEIIILFAEYFKR